MKRITIIAGHYGCGKSEIATHLAIHKKLDYIVDLDIINPYFRSRALGDLFEEHGIILVESTIKGQLNSDMPYVSGEGVVPFVNTDVTAVYDLGGTENGGRVLIQFLYRAKSLEDVDMLYTVNVFRPETADADSIIKAIQKLEGEAQLKVTGLINNSNLMEYTTEDEIQKGEDILKEVSRKTGLPIVYTVVEQTTNIDKKFEGERINLRRLVAEKWL